MRIGIDIDGVVSDSYPFWLGELNRYYGKNISQIHDYQMHLIYDVPWEDMNRFFIENVERLLMTPPPMPGAKGALEKLIRLGHEIYLVTARRPEEEEITRRWLEKYQIPYDVLMLVGDRSKAEVCLELKLELFIEDYAVNANQIAAAGLPVIIFDAPYNQVELRERVVRCYNWGQIFKLIHELPHGAKQEYLTITQE